MADSSAFTTLCEELEGSSTLDRLEARGTVRLALKQAGLEANQVSASQLAVVVEKILPNELRSRGIDQADSICSQLATTLKAMPDEVAGESPEAVFKRLGG
jgi:hypothetical protein